MDASPHPLAAVPAVDRGEPVEQWSCLRVSPRFRSSILSVIRWRCLHDTEQLRSERYHPDFVVSFGFSGASITKSRGRDFLVDSTSALIHWPGSRYRSSHPFGCGDSGWKVAVRRDVALEMLGSLQPRLAEAVEEGRSSPLQSVSNSPRELLRQRVLDRCSLDGDPLAAEEMALELVEAVVGRLSEAPPGRPRPRRRGTREDHLRCAEATRAVLNARLREPVRLEEVARAVNASPFHLCRVFKAATGLTVHRYLTRLRLAAALEELLEGGVPLSQTAVELGFSSHSHLTAAFTRELGVPPSEVRRLARLPTLEALRGTAAFV